MSLFLAGQSNVGSVLQSALFRFLDPYILLSSQVWQGGTGLSASEDYLDWYPFDDIDAETGEMLDLLEERIEESPNGLTGLIWIQGERDRHDPEHTADYEELLTELIESIIDMAGPVPIVIVALSAQAPVLTRHPDQADAWMTIIAAQRSAADAFDNVYLVDPDVVAANFGVDVADMFRDPLHYSAEFASLLLDASLPYLSEVALDPVSGQFLGDSNDNLILTGTQNDIVSAGEGTDRVYASFGNDQVHGGGGDDTLVGGAGDDELHGDDGDDLLFGNDGADLLDGGAGVDLVSYIDATVGVHVSLELQGIAQDTVGAGIDTLLSIESLEGSKFADHLSGDSGVNNITGHEGHDHIRGYSGSDKLEGGPGNDWIFGGHGWDLIRGGGWSDNLFGENGNDRLFGDIGNDHLHGGAGNDYLNGGEGNDVLLGSWGVDEMAGGAGSDTFVFESRKHSGSSLLSADLITDFSQSEGDLIDLSAIDAIAGTAGDDAFTFIGSDRFSGTAGELRFFRNGGDTFLAADVDGDGSADMFIHLSGDLTMTAADFIL